MTTRMLADGALARRLEAYAEARLTPDLATSSRLRARVMVAAHRQAALARSDASLALVPADADAADAPRAAAMTTGRWPGRRLVVAVGLAGALALATVGTALAIRPGAPLYDTRLWAETLTLPADPSQRAIAELSRLTSRLEEAAEASRVGDVGAAAAALSAYGKIVDEASAEALISGDVVAGAALQAGVGRNIVVLQALAGQVPARASVAIGAALERAIDRSDDAVRTVIRGGGDGAAPTGPGSGNDGSKAGGGGKTATPSPDETNAATPDDKASKPPGGKGGEPTATPPGAAAPQPTPATEATPPSASHGPGSGGGKGAGGGSNGNGGGAGGGSDQGGDSNED